MQTKSSKTNENQRSHLPLAQKRRSQQQAPSSVRLLLACIIRSKDINVPKNKRRYREKRKKKQTEDHKETNECSLLLKHDGCKCRHIFTTTTLVPFMPEDRQRSAAVCMRFLLCGWSLKRWTSSSSSSPSCPHQRRRACASSRAWTASQQPPSRRPCGASSAPSC